MENFIQFCEKNQNYDPNDWKKWLNENPDKTTSPNELLGLNEQEYEDLNKKIRSMNFYILKRSFKRNINENLWAGCYVKFLMEMDLMNPHVEYGWVDIVSNEQGFCKIQCDDSYNGCRALTIRIIDVLEVLPFKERPLVYFKTMICGDCNDCDRTANKEVPISCKYYSFFNSILNKQQMDSDFQKMYFSLKEANKETECNCNDNNCNHNDNNCHCKECNGDCQNE
ncbi:MAG: hypothetical protein IKP65_03050 [Alphaproteobacteria bacterium]|nr:hypothetical protein [Alphaproteobacteria bacterium]